MPAQKQHTVRFSTVSPHRDTSESKGCKRLLPLFLLLSDGKLIIEICRKVVDRRLIGKKQNFYKSCRLFNR